LVVVHPQLYETGQAELESTNRSCSPRLTLQVPILRRPGSLPTPMGPHPAPCPQERHHLGCTRHHPATTQRHHSSSLRTDMCRNLSQESWCCWPATDVPRCTAGVLQRPVWRYL
jgi:hypothetical protein